MERRRAPGEHCLTRPNWSRIWGVNSSSNFKQIRGISNTLSKEPMGPAALKAFKDEYDGRCYFTGQKTELDKLRS